MKKSKILIIVCLIFIIAVFIDSFFLGLVIKVPDYNFKDIDQEITWQGQVVKEPDKRIDKVNLTVKNRQLGKVLITLDLSSTYNYGDVLEIKGKILIPKVYQGFDYRQWMPANELRVD